WPVMQRVNLSARKVLEQAVLDHRLGAGLAFFGWLENQVYTAVEPSGLSEVTSRPKQHRGVAIVTTTVSDALMNARVRHAGGFMDGQCIHVGTQSNGAVGASRTDHSHDARFAYPLIYGNAPRTQAIGDQGSGPPLLETELRMLMDVVPGGAHFVGPRPHRRKHRTVH